MKIRNKILLYFSATVIALTALAFIVVYLLFSEYREEQFQQQQHEKIEYTIRLLERHKESSAEISFILDEQDINDFFDEKLLVYNHEKKRVFASLDSLDINRAGELLSQLSASRRWIETKEGNYDLIGVYLVNNGRQYYAISKAYDAFGHNKLSFLRNILIIIFIVISAIVLVISFYLSEKISGPITALAEKLNTYDPGKENTETVDINTSSYELELLTIRFNALVNRTNDAFTFQKHTAHHISHQLKTPLAVLVSELERIQEATNDEKTKGALVHQIIKAKTLGTTINALLEISKIEANQHIKKRPVRVDEMIFDIIEELNIIYPEFIFEIRYSPENMDDSRLTVDANPILLRQAFQNLLTNCISYSHQTKAAIQFDGLQNNMLLSFINEGAPISEEEQRLLFNHFFRGNNSQEKPGFGLGLVLAKKALELNDATISYSYQQNENRFLVRFAAVRVSEEN